MLFRSGERPEQARRFLSEARAQARVRHERVCEVYEVGEVDGRAYIAMRYIEGQPLNVLAPALSLEQKVMVLREVALGVHEAHREGFIHRDIKPSNILVERAEDGRLSPYVMDFGLARDWTEAHTATGAVLGTPQYMAPEQARSAGGALDRRADVYSLGATLYHVLTGQPPFSGATAMEVLHHLLTQEPRPPRALTPDLPVDLEAILLKCLEKDRAARYDSARALAEDLERFLAGEPVLARPAGPGYFLGKWVRRHARAVALGGTALTLVLLALGWAGLTRREAGARERLARRFTEQVERIEALARYSELSRLHDIRGDRRALQARLDALDAEVRQGGALAVGPGHYALGRGWLALGDDARAREHLETAWREGPQEPRVAYALALVMGHLYQARLLEVERLQSAPLRDARRQALEREYREPALAWLRRSEGAEGASPEYVAALLAFYENRYDAALGLLDTLSTRLPWFHEAPRLKGDIFLARAWRHWRKGEREQARADFEAGRQAYATAAAIGESVPGVYQALGELENAAMNMELYGQGEVMPCFTRGMAVASRVLQTDPEHFMGHLLQSRLQRRLAEHLVNKGEDVEPLLTRALEAARAAQALDASRVEGRVERMQLAWQGALALGMRGLDPGERLREAIALAEGLEERDKTYDIHNLVGLIFKEWADHEEQTGKDSLAHRGAEIQAYERALRLDERVPDAWTNLGIAYYTRARTARAAAPDADLEQSLRALDKAQALNPQHVVPYYYAGLVHQRRGLRGASRGEDPRPELARAVERYREGLVINPTLPVLLNGLGNVQVLQAQEEWNRGGDPFPVLARARTSLERAVAVAPKQGNGYNNLGEVEAWRARYLRARGQDPGPSVRAAVELYQQAASHSPGHSTPWANLGGVRSVLAGFELDQGRDPTPGLAQAEQELRRALELNPGSASAWRAQGESRMVRARWRARGDRAREEDFAQAAQAFEKALELEPGNLEARLALGHLCRAWGAWLKRTGQEPVAVWKRGLGLAEEALAASPSWPEALLLRAGVLTALADSESNAESRQRWRAQSLEDFTKALAANPNLKHAWGGQPPGAAPGSL